METVIDKKNTRAGINVPACPASALLVGLAQVEKKLLKFHFQEKLEGRKNWELRKEDDHYFRTGEKVKYREVDYQTPAEYTGRYLVTEVLSVTRDIPGLVSGYCLMSDQVLSTGGYIL
jgi:hypothetical protein